MLHANTVEDLQDQMTRELIYEPFYRQPPPPVPPRPLPLHISEGVIELISKQSENFDNIYQELAMKGRKINHWAWWVWPTEMEGRSEPDPKTSVQEDEIGYLLDHCPIGLWSNILGLICDLIDQKGKHAVIPGIDHGRIKHFCRLFRGADEDLKKDYPFFFNDVNRLCSYNFRG